MLVPIPFQSCFAIDGKDQPTLLDISRVESVEQSCRVVTSTQTLVAMHSGRVHEFLCSIEEFMEFLMSLKELDSFKS